eukprot:423625-Amphidinium_carterae.6
MDGQACRIHLQQIPDRSGWPVTQLKELGSEDKSAIIAIGETMLCQHNFHETQKLPQRLEPQWSYGVWTGRDTSNGNHLTPSSEGRIKSRSVKSLTMPHRFNKAVLMSAVGTPRDPSA